jgi:EmrB/QacA subfamily drug resistance transporter
MTFLKERKMSGFLQDERRRRQAVLKVMSLALMMVVAAVASLNMALPSIARATGASQSQLQWIVDAYALAFAALLLPAGALGDRIGRKPVLLAGLTVFGAASLAAVFWHPASGLIALRVVMGVGAAMVMPVTLSVITTVFPPEERGKAVGTWVGIAAGGGVIGLVSSGLLLQWLSWPSIFVLNVVLASLALLGTVLIVPATRGEHAPRVDRVGTAISVAALVALVYGINEAPDHGWLGTTTLVGVIAGLVGIALFVLWELHVAEPLLDPRNFKRRGFGAGSLSITVQFFAAFGFLFLALPYLQLVMGLSPLRAATALIPMAAVVIPMSRVTPRIAARLGVRVASAAGLALMAAGFGVLTTLNASSEYLHFLAGLLPFAAGMALAGAPATTAIVASLPRSKQGVASAVNDVSRELGGALGIAVLGSLMNAAYRSAMTGQVGGLPHVYAVKARGSLAAAQAIAAHMGPGGQALADHAQNAFVHGFSRGLAGGVVVLLLGAVFVAVRAPGRAESRANAIGAVPVVGEA